MAKSDIFQEGRKTIPRSDPRVVRIEFDKSDLGARKSHTAGLAPKNDFTIVHVKSG